MAKKATVKKVVATEENSVSAPKIDVAMLAEIVKATVSGGFVYKHVDESAGLIAAELVETNSAMADEEGAIATRATQKGIDFMNTQVIEAPVPALVPAPAEDVKVDVKPLFAIDDGIALPTIKRGGRGRAPIFPFDALEVGQSFHIPATAERPDPAKSLASTVSSANAKYAKDTGEVEEVTVNKYQVDENGKRVKDAEGHYVKIGSEIVKRPKTAQEREFVLRSVDVTDPRGKGARVFRLR